MTEVAVVVGVSASEGLGAAVARRFAAEGMHAVVAGRRLERLQEVAEEITAAGGAATPCVADATDADALTELVTRAAGLGAIKSVVFNVGNNQPIAFDDLDAEQFESFLRVCTVAGFLTAKAALPELERNGGSLLFTGASASLRGRPGFGHFSAAKGALRNLAQAIARDYGPRGVHVGHVVVDGVIDGERVRTAFSGYIDSLGEDGSLQPDAIAEAFWFLHCQPRNAWTFELDVRPFKENW